VKFIFLACFEGKKKNNFQQHICFCGLHLMYQ